MKLRNIWAVYFSPTGTTRTVVHTIAERLAQTTDLPLNVSDFTLPPARKTPLSFAEGDLVILGTPVYAGRVPNLLTSYISTMKGHGALAVPIVVYGNRAYDDALIELRNLMEEDGFHSIAGGAFIGEHAFGRTLAAGRPDVSDLTIAKGFSDLLHMKLETLSPKALEKPVFVKGNDPIGPYFRPLDAAGHWIDIRKVKPKTTEACIDCKWCAKHCPMGAIDYEEVTQVPGICIKCNACVKGCPVSAKYFDDPGFLFHRQDIAATYGLPRKEPEYFL